MAVFSGMDLKQMTDQGLHEEELHRQLSLFKAPPPYLKLLRSCMPGDGINVIPPEARDNLIHRFERARANGRALKFVPASGAASRMFKDLLWYRNNSPDMSRTQVLEDARKGRKEGKALLAFMDGIREFAFFDALRTVMAKRGIDIEQRISNGKYREILEFLLTDRGLGYAALPKGLLYFHGYETGPRTPFEEHLVEAAFTVSDGNGSCVVHFTVSEEHMEPFRALLAKVQASYERRYGAGFNVAFSIQKPATDTLAADLDNRPFRQEDGRLLFRPAGHGALIENLNELQGDILFIKNIDNVVPDRLKEPTILWKKILGGYLVTLQERIFSYLGEIADGNTDGRFLREVFSFLDGELSMRLPQADQALSAEDRVSWLVNKLHRPIRVCGMVSRAGEPGGGPFWVADEDGQPTRQIVETAQIDPQSESQQAILAASTHFNPVDIVCGVRDWRGEPFDLRRFVDPNAIIITRKSQGGRDLKTLERPGLWNGGMARWITVFVEVPPVTFNPVKTVLDLLRKEHQPH